MSGFISKRVKREFLDACEKLQVGALSLTTPEGSVHHFGSGEPQATITINDWAAITTTAARGDPGFGESYVQGLWDTDSIEDLVTVVLLNYDAFEELATPTLFNTLKYRVIDRVLRANSTRGASRNIRAHYDVGNEFYRLWLDETMTYSSALFDGTDDLATAQRNKYGRILNRLKNSESLLEIGCGWGGFA